MYSFDDLCLTDAECQRILDTLELKAEVWRAGENLLDRRVGRHVYTVQVYRARANRAKYGPAEVPYRRFAGFVVPDTIGVHVCSLCPFFLAVSLCAAARSTAVLGGSGPSYGGYASYRVAGTSASHRRLASCRAEGNRWYDIDALLFVRRTVT